MQKPHNLQLTASHPFFSNKNGNWRNIEFFTDNTARVIDNTSKLITVRKELTTIKDVLAYLASLSEDGGELTFENMFYLTIANNLFVHFTPKTEGVRHYRFYWKNIPDTTLLDKLINEILAVL